MFVPAMQIENVYRQINAHAVIPQIGHDPLVGFVYADNQRMYRVLLQRVPLDYGIEKEFR